MDIDNFTIHGYTLFYCSLLRFNRSMESSDAAELTYTLYRAVLSSYRLKNPDYDIAELAKFEFYGKLMEAEQRPYRTIIQLFRAMEAVLFNSTPFDSLGTAELLGVAKMSGMMDDMALLFRRLYYMEIDDKRTVFKICARSLIPHDDEPGLCLLQDWYDSTVS